jgi:hypothetical protein
MRSPASVSSSHAAMSVAQVIRAVGSLRPASPMMSMAYTSRLDSVWAYGAQLTDVIPPPWRKTIGVPSPAHR